MPFRLKDESRNQQGTLIPGRYGLQARSILPKRKSAITLIRASLTISALMEIITNVQCVLFIMIKYKLALAVEQLTSRNNYLPSVTIGNKNRHPLRDGCLPWLAKAILSCFCKGNTNYLKSKRNLPVHVNPISIRSTATIGAKRPSPPHWGGFRRGWIKEPKAPVLFRH